MNQYAKLYKTISNTRLLDIIQHEADYEPEALEAAKAEIASRNWSEEDLAEAQEILDEKRGDKKREDKKRHDREEKVKEVAKTAVETVNPFQDNLGSAEMVVRLMSVVFGLIAVYQVIVELEYIRATTGSLIRNFHTDRLLYILPLIFLPFAVYLFWTRSKTGWFLMLWFLVHTSYTSGGKLFRVLNFEFGDYDVLFDPVSQPSLALLSFKFIFFAGFLWTILRKSLRHYFEISPTRLFVSIGIIIAILIRTYWTYI